jgi:alpha-L-glutamate ligase-like protein
MNPWSALRHRGVLGINRRNGSYMYRCNHRRLYPRVDDKLLTKRICEEAGIPTPRLLAVARHHFELRSLLPSLDDQVDFVVKPSRGAMGNGVLVIIGRDGDRGWLNSSGETLSDQDIRYHAASIISGLFSLGGRPDAAFAEERLRLHPEMAEIVANGVPDLRVVVYRGVPVMAMTRLPTRRSRGRANLHQGAVGAGVSLATGRITHAVLGASAIRRHPDTDHLLVGRLLPAFDAALEIAVAASHRTGLGYVGADVVIDAERGPVVLELNARPGLSIQLANRRGLEPRLRAVDAKLGKGVADALPHWERIAFGRGLAAEDVA